MISTPMDAILSSTSITLSSSFPSRNMPRNFSLVALPVFSSTSAGSLANLRGCGKRISSTLFSAAASACSWTFFTSCSLVIFTEISARSRTIDSTSLPT